MEEEREGEKLVLDMKSRRKIESNQKILFKVERLMGSCMECGADDIK